MSLPTAHVVYYPQPVAPTNNWASTSFTVGLVGTVCFYWITFIGLGFFIIPIALFGVISGHIGFSSSMRTGCGKSLAVWGLVLNYIPIVITVTGVLFFIGVLMASSNGAFE